MHTQSRLIRLLAFALLFALLTAAGMATAEAQSSSTTTLTVDPTTVVEPADLAAVATVTPTAGRGSGPTPTGTLTLNLDGVAVLPDIPLVHGASAIAFPTSDVPTGKYEFSVTYSGDSTYAPSTSATVDVTITATTSTTLAISPGTITQGQTATLTAMVAKSSGLVPPTGSVSFYYGSSLIGSAKLSLQGTSTFSASTSGVPAGTYSLTAKYSGDTGSLASTSAPISVILRALTKTVVNVTPTTVPANSKATLSATVMEQTGKGIPTGSVTFYTEGIALATATLSNGVATATASSSGAPAGTYPVYAVYAGDTSNGGSTSTSISVTVK
jgi:Bacterial Ig-like domain (group 3)